MERLKKGEKKIFIIVTTTSMDIIVQGLGRIKIDELMLYELKDGQIVSEQSFY